MEHDLIIRGGHIVDGLGSEPFTGDIAVSNGVIVAIGEVEGSGRREIDACGFLVTPGFVDVHTHYDGQAIWSDRLNPSSAHGVTTVLTGNCGVGFAPCRAEDHDTLVDVMAGVEDIPEAVMAKGLDWSWETFPEYLDALEARPRDIDVATLLPHSPLRVYVMGKRGVEQEAATTADLARMKALTAEAVRAGALGIGSSQLMMHKTAAGAPIPTYKASEAEFRALAEGVAEAGGGLLQLVPDVPISGYDAILLPFFGVAREVGLPLTFTLATGNEGFPDLTPALRNMEAERERGGRIVAQIYPRPIGLIAGLDLSAHPFVLCPSYAPLADLPLAERVAEMRRPDLRIRLLAEAPAQGHPLAQMARSWSWMFPLGARPNYEPPLSESIAARAAARGVSPEEEAYDRLLDDDGRAMLLIALGNFPEGRLDQLGELIRRDDVVVGLGDGGAHYGMICDASYPTFVLTHWTRDRARDRIPIAEAVRLLSSKPAALLGLSDRGAISVGLKADLNVIDHASLQLGPLTVRRDLPGGGRRLDQIAHGYVATIVSGEIIAEMGEPTGLLPGRLIRGSNSSSRMNSPRVGATD